MYQLQIQDIDTYENKYYYRLRITTAQSTCYRDVRVRLQDLAQLARNLQNDNYQHHFPPFPEKSLFSSWFQNNESKEELQENFKAVQTYLYSISKNTPFKAEAISQFVSNTFDPQRSQKLKFAQINKQLFYKSYVKTGCIKKGKFNKVFRVSADKQVYVVHQFLMPQNNDVAKAEFEAYKRYQQLITDHTNIVMCYEIGQITKKSKSFFNKKIKNTVYNQMKLSNDAQYDVFYAIEEYVQQPMNQIIQLRQQTQQYFDLEILLECMLTLVTVATYFQFLQIQSKQFSVSNLFYDEKKGFKVGGLSPIFTYKKKYRLKFETDLNEYKALNPPEQSGQAGSYQLRFPNNKTDVWQIGIIILSMATLSLPNDLVLPDQICEKILLASFHYGEMLANLIKSMLERTPYDRCTLTDIQNQAQQLLPMKLVYLKQESMVERIKIQQLSQQQLEELDKQFKEKSQRKYIITMNIDKPIVQQILLFNLTLMKRECVLQLYMNVQPQQISDDLFEKMMAILCEYKHLQFLVLNFKKCQITEQSCYFIIHKAQQIRQLKQLTLHIPHQISLPKTTIRLIIYNQ